MPASPWVMPSHIAGTPACHLGDTAGLVGPRARISSG